MSGSFSEFMEAIRISESQGHGGYQADTGRHIGAYQMGVEALISTGYLALGSTGFSSGWTGKDGINSKQDFKDSETVQDNAIQDYWLNTQWLMETLNRGLEIYAGQTLNGYRLTLSGMIAASHLVGSGDLARFIRSGGTDIGIADGNGTLLVDHLRNFANYNVPAAYVTNLDKGNTFKGGVGDDGFTGEGGNDVFLPGGGNDEIWGGRKDDDQGAGDGFDTVSYADYSKPIRLGFSSQNGIAYALRIRDGSGGIDDLHSIENVVGTSKRDFFAFAGKIPNVFGDYFLTIDANDGQGGSVRDSIYLKQHDGDLRLYIGPDASGEIVSTSTGGKIKLTGFHTSVVGSDFDDEIDDQSTGHKQIDGGQGNDVISAGGDGALLFGGDGDDRLTGGDGNDLLDSGYGTNTLSGGAASDHLIARGFSDTLDGGAGADYLETVSYGAILNGGTGNDVIDVRKGSETIIKFGPNDGHDYVISGPFDLTQVGLGGPQTPSITVDLQGVSSSDISYIFSSQSISGESWPAVGNPVDIPGAAWIHGDLTILINSTGATLTIQNAGGSAGFQLYNSSRNYSGNLTDLINITPVINILFNGLPGNGSGPGDSPPIASLGDVSAYTTAPADYAAGAAPSSADTTGTSGNDSLTGGLGDDALSGGAGDDDFATSGGNDAIDGGDGYDTIVTLGSSWQFRASFDNDTLSLTDTVGAEGKLTLASVEAIDFLGDDVTTTVLIGTAESDVVQGDSSSILYGAAGDDTLIGGDGRSQLFGGAGSDHLEGGSGAEILVGGEGTDLLEGGAGSDQYFWSLGDGSDTIVDLVGDVDWNDLTLQDVRSFEISLASDGDDLLITAIASGEVIRIRNQLVSDGLHGVDGLAFSNGQYWDRVT